MNVIREEHLLFKYDKTCKIGFTYKNLKYNRDINSIAYIIYTSGTSGHPKGVMVGDQNIISTMKACCRRLELDNEKFLIKSNKAFDFSIFELLVIFFSGNSVFI
ncbi:TPA: AMP-binding protein [Streptococcus pneumoniae]|nr:AMP-binding protein [Streptococcus pneumoniae]